MHHENRIFSINLNLFESRKCAGKSRNEFDRSLGYLDCDYKSSETHVSK